MDPISATSAIVTIIDAAHKTLGILKARDADRLRFRSPLATVSDEPSSKVRELYDNIGAALSLLESLQLFCADYKDRNVAQKLHDLQELDRKNAPLFKTLKEYRTDFTPKLRRGKLKGLESDFLEYQIAYIRNFHQELRNWVQDVVNSPIRPSVEMIASDMTVFQEHTISTFQGSALPETELEILHNVEDIDSWVFYKLSQTWVSSKRQREASCRMARMSILFWDFNTTGVMPRLFRPTLSETSCEEIASLLRRPACSLKIWTQTFESSDPGYDRTGNSVKTGSQMMIMMKSRIARRKRTVRSERTARLRERSLERRPYPPNQDLREALVPERTTFVFYHAPVALSRNEEDWSMLGAVCHEHHRAVSVISSNTYFQNAPNELARIVSARDYYNEPSVDMGPFKLVLEMIAMLTDKDAAEATRHAANIYDIERKLRLFVPDSSSRSASGIDLDFQFLTTTLSSAISRLNFHQMRLDGNLAVVRELLDKIEDYAVSDQFTQRDEFRRAAEALQTSIQHWLTDVKFNLEIGKIQLQVANTMISQRDARDSVRLTQSSMDIAKAAKADSSIMKMLAILGAIFLPGTYVSALFSMNMFDWQAEPGGQVVSPYFWIYWVVMAPITIIVATLVVLFIFVKSPSGLAGYTLDDLKMAFGSSQEHAQSEGRMETVDAGPSTQLLSMYRSSHEDGAV